MGEHVVGFGCERPVRGVHGAAAVVSVVREVVGEHIADRDEYAARDGPATAVGAEEPVSAADFGTRAVSDAARGAGVAAGGGRPWRAPRRYGGCGSRASPDEMCEGSRAPVGRGFILPASGGTEGASPDVERGPIESGQD